MWCERTERSPLPGLLLAFALLLASSGGSSPAAQAFPLREAKKTAFVPALATRAREDIRTKMRKQSSAAEGEGPRLRSHATTTSDAYPAPATPGAELKDHKLQKAKWSDGGPAVLVSSLWKQGELFARSVAVFWTAARLFLDYKILQWRTVCLRVFECVHRLSICAFMLRFMHAQVHADRRQDF